MVDITEIIIILRNFAVKEGYMADSHKKTASNMMNTGHTIPLTDDYRNLRKNLGLSEQPPTVLGNPKALEDWKKIMKITGFDKLIGGK
jgi:heterodisulfide reductase subunit C